MLAANTLLTVLSLGRKGDALDHYREGRVELVSGRIPDQCLEAFGFAERLSASLVSRLIERATLVFYKAPASLAV